VTIRAGSDDNFLIGATRVENQTATFAPGVHHYAFISYFSGNGSFWSVGSVAAANVNDSPRCLSRVTITPRLDCVKELGVFTEYFASWGYTMTMDSSQAAPMPYLELGVGTSNSADPTSDGLGGIFYFGNHVRN
jgi:hypothetical protein